MAYAVKELFYSLQGEGVHAGRPAIFCRFAGCNLWSGREEDRSTATCQFCDTDFVGQDGPYGKVYRESVELAEIARRLWPYWDDASIRPFLICTGGEPLLQLDQLLVSAFHAVGFDVALETNGTLPITLDLDWVCVSPKAGAPFVATEGDELKVVFPQSGLDPLQYEHLDFKHFVIQPMDGPSLTQNICRATQFCLEHPKWRLSLQIHKLVGIP